MQAVSGKQGCGFASLKCGSGSSFSLIKLMWICDHWSVGSPGLYFKPPSLHCERPQLCFEPLKLLNFDFNADSDPAFHSNPDLVRIQLPKIMRIQIRNPAVKTPSLLIYCYPHRLHWTRRRAETPGISGERVAPSGCAAARSSPNTLNLLPRKESGTYNWMEPISWERRYRDVSFTQAESHGTGRTLYYVAASNSLMRIWSRNLHVTRIRVIFWNFYS